MVMSQPIDLKADAQIRLAFSDLKKEILLGQQDILEGKVTSLAHVRQGMSLSL